MIFTIVGKQIQEPFGTIWVYDLLMNIPTYTPVNVKTYKL